VTDADVEKRLHELQENHAKLVLSKDTVLEKKHFAVVDYESFLDGQPLKNGKASNQLIELGATQNVEGFSEGLLGAKDGDVREIPVAFPAEHPQKDLAGKTVTFKTTVTAIKEKVLPALDDEFAKDEGAKDLAEIKERFRKELEESARRTERDDLEKQVVEGLLQRNPFEVPASQVEERAKQLTEHLKKYLLERGAAVTDWAANEEKMREKKPAGSRTAGSPLLHPGENSRDGKRCGSGRGRRRAHSKDLGRRSAGPAGGCPEMDGLSSREYPRPDAGGTFV
jgi:trigger factor